MDDFKIIFVGGKFKLVYDGHTYAYSSSIGTTGLLWNCLLKPCTAHVKTNKTKDKITGGNYVHIHEKEAKDSTKYSPSKLNSPSSGKKNKTTDMTKEQLTPKISPPTMLPPANSLQSTPVNNDLNKSLLAERDAAIDTIAIKQQEKDKLEAELADCKILITSLQESVRTIEAAWDADKAELEALRKQLAASSTPEPGLSQSSRRKIKLSIVGDSHVHNLKPLLQNIFTNFDIECYAKSGARVDDICSISVRQHGPDDIVILFVGTNDVCKTSWSTLEESFGKLIEKFNGCKLISILLPPRRNATEFNSHIYSLNVKISNLLKKKGLSYVNPALILKNKHFSRDNLHLNKSGKQLVCEMLKSHIVENKQFSILAKSETNHTRSDRVDTVRVNKPQSVNNKKTLAIDKNTRAIGSSKQQNFVMPNNSHKSGPMRNRYIGNVVGSTGYSRENKHSRGGFKKRKMGQQQHRGRSGRQRHSNPRFQSREVYNSAFHYPGYYPPLPPTPCYYDYEFLTTPYHNSYDYDYYYNPEPYGYNQRQKSRSMRRTNNKHNFFS